MSTHLRLYTKTVSVGTDAVYIQKNETAGVNGAIPSDMGVQQVSIIPNDSSKTYYIKGFHTSADWILIGAGQKFEVLGLSQDTWDFFQVKSASGTITMNLYVKGQVG